MKFFKKKFSRRDKTQEKNKICFFCQKKLEPSYTEVDILKKFVSDRGKILGRDRNGLCRKHQKRFARAVKRARHLALMPFVVKPY